MGKIKALVTEMGYDSAKRYLEELKLKLERDKKKELTGLVARGEVELPKKWQSNPQKWVDIQVQKSLKDRLVIDSNTSVEELIKISGKQ